MAAIVVDVLMMVIALGVVMITIVSLEVGGKRTGENVDILLN